MEINIPETAEKGNSPIIKRIFWPVFAFLAVALVFGGIKLASIESSRPPVTLEYGADVVSAVQTPTTASLPSKTDEKDVTASAKHVGTYVAARGGTVYYLPSCAAAKRIAEKNKIWFETKQEAEKFGYKPAKNCKGL